MEQRTDVLDLLSLDSQLRPPSECRQTCSSTDDLESFVRARIDHITAALRILKFDTRKLNTICCRFLVGPRRTFEEVRFRQLVLESKGGNQWICCGPDKGQRVHYGSEDIAEASPNVASPGYISANEDVDHGSDSPVQLDSGTEHQAYHERSVAMSQSAQLEDLKLRYQGTRTEMIERVTQEIDLLKTTLINRVKDYHNTRPTRRTRQSQADSSRDSQGVLLDDLVTESLGNFTASLITTLDAEFIRLFPELSNHDEPLAAATAELESRANTTEAQDQSTLADAAITLSSEDRNNLQNIKSTTSKREGDATSALSIANETELEDLDRRFDFTQIALATSESSKTIQSSPQAVRPDSDLDSLGPTRKRAAKRRFNTGRKKRKVPMGIAAQLVGEESIQRFIILVRRLRFVHMPLTTVEFNTSGGWKQRAAGYWQLARALGDSSSLYGLLSLLAQVEVAGGLDRAAKELGYNRVPSSMIGDVLETLGMDASTASRRKFQDRLRKPRKLIKVFGPHLGLLPFVSLEEEDPYSVTVNCLLDLSEKAAEVASFHSFLKASELVIVLLEMGRKFRECVLSHKRFPDMLFEKIDDEVLCDLALC